MAKKSVSGASRARQIVSFEEAVQAIAELQPDCPHTIYISASHDLWHCDARRTHGVTYTARCYMGERREVVARGTTPRELVARCITDLFPQLTAKPALPDDVVRALPGQKMLRLT